MYRTFFDIHYNFIIVQSNFVGVTKTIDGPSLNDTNVTMVKEIEVHLTEKFVQVFTIKIYI